MKKFLSCAAILCVATTLLLTGCASTGKASDPVSVHPRDYVLDLSDSITGTTINVVYNQYGPNYQSDPAIDYTKRVRKDKPKAGDTIQVYYKFSTDIDIPAVRISLIDPTVNYWLELAADDAIMLENIKAGEIVEGSKDIVLTNSVSGEFKVYIAYDNADLIDDDHPAVNGPAVFTFYDVEGIESTDVEKELPVSETAKGPKTINIQIDKIAGFCEIATGHPWVDGQQIMSEIENYQADISYMSLLEEEVEEGDILNITWRGKPSQDISELKMMPVDHSASVGWWKIMINDTSDDNVIIARDLKAGEVFEITKTFVIDTASASTDCNLRVWYEYDKETNGPGPCTIIAVRN
ncbi:MAG: hypothetical protein K6A43_09025 [Treponema sp.]|nr:hypothetical protein [Treponema sp.]